MIFSNVMKSELKIPLSIIIVFIAFTGSVQAQESLQKAATTGTSKTHTDHKADMFCNVARDGISKFEDPALPYENDKILYSGLEKDLKSDESGACYKRDPEEKSPQRKRPEQEWGIAAGLRVARIPFDMKDNTVTNFIPQLFYEDDLVFLHGLEGGIKIAKWDKWQLNALARLRFFDIPKSFQNEIQEDSVDMGLQLRYLLDDDAFVELEVLSDTDYQFHANVRTGLDLAHGALEWTPYANLDFKSSDYNDYYFGLEVEDVDSGVDISVGIRAQYHLTSNLYLIGSFQMTYLDRNVRHSPFVDRNYLDETFLGIKFSNERDKSRKESLRNTPYVRLAHGWATPSNMGEILSGDTEDDKYNNQLTSIFYGHPLTDELFGLPLDIYLMPGFVWHWSSSVQPSSQEYILCIKAYYTFKWPIVWRLGAAEGASYASRVTYIEESELNKKDYEVSKLMNYLDFSIDINLSDLFDLKSPNELWLGYYIHHRSAIFESASHYGRIKGGSNYNSIYLQYHF